MGYRSEVSLTILNADFDALALSARTECPDAYDILKCAEITQGEDYTVMLWSWIKWYEFGFDIGFIESFRNGVPHVFHRLGEDNEDYEYSANLGDDYEHGAMVDCVDIVRELEVYSDGKPIKLE